MKKLTVSLNAEFLSDEILLISTPPDFPGIVTKEIAIRDVLAIRTLIGDRKYCAVLFLFSDVNVQQDARSIIVNDSKFLTALAFILRSRIQRLIFNFIMLVKRSDYPIKSFTQRDDALEWLNKKLDTAKEKDEITL